MEKNKRRLFFSHSSKDKKYGQAVVKLLRSIGLQKEQILFSSDPDYAIPVNTDIFEYLKEQIQADAYMLYLLSDQYYDSIACMNEMGAAWVMQNDYALIAAPSFDIRNSKFQKGAINPRKIVIHIDIIEEMSQFIDMLQPAFGLVIEKEEKEKALSIYSKEVQQLLQREKKEENSLSAINKQIANNPIQPELYVKRGTIQYNENNYIEAIRDYLYAIFLNPNCRDAYYKIAEKSCIKGQMEQAVAFANEACKRFPEDGSSFGMLGYVQCRQNFYQQAIENCTKAIQMKNNRWFYNTRGRCYWKQNKLKLALNDFYKAHILDANYQPAIDNIKKLSNEIGLEQLLDWALEERESRNFEQAKEYFECILLVNPKYEEALQEYGGLYYNLKKGKQAFFYYKKALDLNKSCKNYYLCACACYMMGEEIKTIEFCQNALLQLDDKGYKKLTKDLIERIQK